MKDLKTTIGLEIHVQLKTKSKMFCRCDNFAEGKAPNTVVCPVCLGLPGALPVANYQAIEWTIKTGLALDCEIAKVAKFDRKHYFYPDLPKGYQISQYDEPFATHGRVEMSNYKYQTSNSKEETIKIRLNRIHLEEDAGKLIHSGGKSLVDLNRAGTPLMEIVTEPDITSPEMAGDFLRKLQKIVRDVSEVSEASMEKGHMRCDANISLTDGTIMSPIIELKNLNSFKFVEKALTLVRAHLAETYDSRPKKLSKETWGYDSVNNKVYLQRRKEEAADYRYFPCPDLPPFESSVFDLNKLRSELKEDVEQKLTLLRDLDVPGTYAGTIALNNKWYDSFILLRQRIGDDYCIDIAEAIAQLPTYFGDLKGNAVGEIDFKAEVIKNRSTKSAMRKIFEKALANPEMTYLEIKSIIDSEMNEFDDEKIGTLITDIIEKNPNELNRYRQGEKQLFGFFMGKLMKETQGKANPQKLNQLLREKLETK
ncbi:MAG: Asp-tRNA(Asn)/Glu-tRNA(Gln) amidotransferase subunit GatB [Candidatus Berkelbacteria bacterium]|nr:Asp-tRNA(Asn)/Glu-tRNA(Gln) amidotransferase subunit GatB [Candidatus Berkelbacteria bacterium]